jgi:hypothetical protein
MSDTTNTRSPSEIAAYLKGFVADLRSEGTEDDVIADELTDLGYTDREIIAAFK